MGTAERRLEIMKYLCRKRYSTMPELAVRFGVSVRTIQRDIFEIETTFRIPLNIKAGKNGGGIYVIGDYTMDRMYMCDEETELMVKLKNKVGSLLSDDEKLLLEGIIRKYTRPAL